MHSFKDKLRLKRPAERGSVLMIARWRVRGGTCGISAWGGVRAARAREVGTDPVLAGYVDSLEESWSLEANMPREAPVTRAVTISWDAGQRSSAGSGQPSASRNASRYSIRESLEPHDVNWESKPASSRG